MSVNAIAREAGVSRSAFYDQYSDLDALSIDMLTEIFGAAASLDVEKLVRGESRRAAAEAAAREFLEYIAEHRSFFVSSLEWRTSSSVPESVHEALAANYRIIFDALGDAVPASVDREDLALFLAGGTIALITRWMRQSPPASTRDFGQRLLALHPDWLVGD